MTLKLIQTGNPVAMCDAVAVTAGGLEEGTSNLSPFQLAMEVLQNTDEIIRRGGKYNTAVARSTQRR